MWGGLSGSRRSEGGSEYLRISFWMCFRCSTYQPSTAHHTCTVQTQAQQLTRLARALRKILYSSWRTKPPAKLWAPWPDNASSHSWSHVSLTHALKGAWHAELPEKLVFRRLGLLHHPPPPASACSLGPSPLLVGGALSCPGSCSPVPWSAPPSSPPGPPCSAACSTRRTRPRPATRRTARCQTPGASAGIREQLLI